MEHNYKILIIDYFHNDLLNNLNQFKFDYKPEIQINELEKIINDYDILIISTRIRIDKSLIKRAKKLKLIIRMGIGVDHIDLKECKERKIIVCNTPNSNISGVVELIFGQIINFYRNLSLAHKNVLDGKFRKDLPLGIELKNKIIGIIGVGRIGSYIANISKAFGMNTVGYDPYLSITKKKKRKIDHWLSLNELLEKSDIVTIHTPLTEETKYMVNKNFLLKMKDNSILINTARGKIINFFDLIEILSLNKIKKVILDVFENEPYVPDIPENLESYFYFSPHIGAYTEESFYNRCKETIDILNEFINNKKLHSKINLTKGY